MNWQEIIKDYRDPHGTAISEGYEEQLVEEYQGMITELIHDLQEIQKLDNLNFIYWLKDGELILPNGTIVILNIKEFSASSSESS